MIELRFRKMYILCPQGYVLEEEIFQTLFEVVYRDAVNNVYKVLGVKPQMSNCPIQVEMTDEQGSLIPKAINGLSINSTCGQFLNSTYLIVNSTKVIDVSVYLIVTDVLGGKS